MKFFNVIKLCRRGILLPLLALVLLLAGPNVAWAAASCSGPNPSSFTVTLPGGTFGVPRDVPVGTVLTPWTAWQGATNVWSCNYTANVYIGPVYQAAFSGSTIVPVGVTTTAGGAFMVYPTNLQGVGVIAQAAGNTPSSAWGAYTAPLNASWLSASAWDNSVSGSGAGFGFAYKLAFVKTGTMASGVATASGQIGKSGMDSRPIGSPSSIAAVFVSGSATFNVIACTTPDVTVPLGSHSSTELTGVNTFTSATNFNVSLNSCPAGMNAIQYRIDPVTTVINSAQSVVALNPSSGATGVGVQLLDGTGAVMPLSTYKTFSGYSTSAGGNYAIPLKARYYQTGTKVGAGTANSSMTFTMLYQ